VDGAIPSLPSAGVVVCGPQARRQGALHARVREATAQVVARQQKIGLDVISDGELGKVDFSSYVLPRLSGFRRSSR
jgi:methionine synthase II (cobalamin-independent)